jgi:hypothetical protein
MKTHKKCTTCKETLEITNFWKDKSRGDGYNCRCKSCAKAKNKIYMKTYAKKYYQDNKDKITEQRKARYNNNPAVRVANSMRCRIYNTIVKGYKSATTFELIGCDADQLVSHIEKQFTEGMSWDNYGEWHIDHIKPICSFDILNPTEQLKCYHYTNLQPLWAHDNLSKGGKY